MSKSHSFSIYLLKENYDATNALKEDHLLDDDVIADGLPDGSSLFLLDNPPREPWWKRYFSIKTELNQGMKSALIFLPAGERIFALSFGYAYHSLKEESYEYDFGLRVTLNAVDPEKIKNTDTLEPDAARRQRTQLSIDSSLAYFDFDNNSSILKSLTGKVKEEYKDTIKHVTGAKNLRVSSAVKSTELAHLCNKLLALYESEEYKKNFPEIQNVVPVNDPDIIGKLNTKLLGSFQIKDERVELAIPDILDYQDNLHVRFRGAGGSFLHDEVYIALYYKYLDEQDCKLTDVTLGELKKHKLELTDENGSPRQSYPIFKSLLYDTILDSANETYHLSEGNWYRVDNNYITKLESFLDSYCRDLELPDYEQAGEGEYNKSVADNNNAYLCLDKANISLTGQTQIEPCDLYSVNGDCAKLLHIKRSTRSSQLSHLFNQGTNAVELLRQENNSIQRFKTIVEEKVNGKTPAGTTDNFTRPLENGNFEVIFGIITHKDGSEKSRAFPLFSRISLMRNIKSLQLMNVKASYGFISDKSS